MLVHLQPGQIHVVDGRLSVSAPSSCDPQQVNLILSSNHGRRALLLKIPKEATWYGPASSWLFVCSHSRGGSQVEGGTPGQAGFMAPSPWVECWIVR